MEKNSINEEKELQVTDSLNDDVFFDDGIIDLYEKRSSDHPRTLDVEEHKKQYAFLESFDTSEIENDEETNEILDRFNEEQSDIDDEENTYNEPSYVEQANGLIEHENNELTGYNIERNKSAKVENAGKGLLEFIKAVGMILWVILKVMFFLIVPIYYVMKFIFSLDTTSSRRRSRSSYTRRRSTSYRKRSYSSHRRRKRW